jgi:superfamily II DNA or RNA helicase
LTPTPGRPVRSRSGAFPGTATLVQLRPSPAGDVAVVDTADGDFRRVPASDLECVLSLADALVAGQVDPPDRWRLRRIALEVLSEQQRTGMASALRLTPLPHQVLAAHHAVDGTSGRVLVADDVGMGKTIEIGLTLAVLAARDEATRVLILCPAGIRGQWRSELLDLFGMGFDIIGADGDASAKGRNVWARYNHAIASIDLLRREDHRDRLAEAPAWDLVIVDEAHRVTAREQSGGPTRAKSEQPGGTRSAIYRTQTYQLVEMLSRLSRRLIFATATPHQGRDDQFLYLLRLLRPDVISEADCLSSLGLERIRPRLGELMIRTPKRLAADWGGQRIFQGSVARTVRVPVPPEDDAFRDALLTYIEMGYAAADAARSTSSAAVLINFVMTTFLKLWASSRAAIRQALDNRRGRLEEARRIRLKVAGKDDAALAADAADAADGEAEGECLDRVTGAEFFEDEIRLLSRLLGQLDALGPDPKVVELVGELERLRTETLSGVLIFTEYLNSQRAVVDALKARFGPASVAQIRGGHGAENRAAAQEFQRGNVPFLVSTQAGGEGLNLQHGGHVLVNFDQPWNPMRTLQRIGRLDRFGQKSRVVVVNLVRESAIDDRIQIKTWEKLQKATAAIAAAQGAHPEDLAEAVIGEFVEHLDMRALLRASLRPETDAEATRLVNLALEKVQSATSRAESLFKGLDAFQLGDPKVFAPVALGDSIRGVVEGVLKAHHRRLDKNTDGTFRFKLPEDWRGERGMEKEYPAVVFDARGAEASPHASVMGFGVPVFERMVQWARADACPAGVTCFRAAGPRSTCGIVAIYSGRMTFNRDCREFRQTRTWEIAVTASGEDLQFEREGTWLPSTSPPSHQQVEECLRRSATLAEQRLVEWISSRGTGDNTTTDLVLDSLAWVEVSGVGSD